MADENGAGYKILELKLQNMEDKIHGLKKEIKDIKKDNKEKFADNDEKFEELNDKVSDSEKSMDRIQYSLDTLNKNQEEMKEDIKIIAASAGKDQNWRAVLTGIIKIGAIIMAYLLGDNLFKFF